MKCEKTGPAGIKPELLAPGGSLEKCRIAFLYGADAVYAGGREYSLRAYARNLNDEELAAASLLARRNGRKLYVTVNVFAREPDLRSLPTYLEYLRDIRVDGIIVSDPGVISLASRVVPDLPIHLSTQANTVNSLSVNFWRDCGVRRVNLARELTIGEIRAIREATDVELEVFVHGAMCVSYSGRCLLSAFLNDRSANLGKCSQPCRWSYRLVEEKRPGEYFPIHEDPRGTYIFNSKDLRLVDDLPELTALGLDAFKIEGRMKGALYLASVVRTYRAAIDEVCGASVGSASRDRRRDDLERISHRPYTRGLMFPGPDSEPAGVDIATASVQTDTLAGIVRPPLPDLCEDRPFDTPDNEDWIHMELRSRLFRGAILEFLYPDGSTRSYRLDGFENLNGARLQVAHPNALIRIPVSFPTFPFQVIRTKSTE